MYNKVIYVFFLIKPTKHLPTKLRYNFKASEVALAFKPVLLTIEPS